jgi:hypothetical protein
MKFVKSGDVLGGSVARETLQHSNCLPRMPDSQPSDSLIVAVESHGKSVFPMYRRIKPGPLASKQRTCASVLTPDRMRLGLFAAARS